MRKSKILNEEQLKKLLFITKVGSNGLRNVLILTFSYYCGLRSKELSSIKIGDVVTEEGTLKEKMKLGNSSTKGEEYRCIYLPNKKVNKISPKEMSRVLKNIYVNGGSEYNGCSGNGGRRYMISKLISQGIPISKVQYLAGHSCISVTMGYADSLSEE